MANSVIKQVNIGDKLYDIEALKFGGMTYEEFIVHVHSIQIIVSSSAADTPKGVVWTNSSGTTITGTLEASAAKPGCIYLVPSVNATGDVYDEYLPVNGVWEKIGNTDIKLSGIKTGGPDKNYTGGVSGAGTVNVTSDGYTASTNVTITYKKAKTASSNSASTDAFTSEQGGHSHSFTGTQETITISSSGSAGSAGGHSHTVKKSTASVIKTVTSTPTTVYSAPEATEEDGAHEHTVNIDSHEHGTAVTAVTGVTSNGTASVVTGVTSNGTATVVTGVTLGTTSIYQITGVGSAPTKKTLTASNVAAVNGEILYIGSAIAGSTNTTPQTIQVIDSVGSVPTRSAINVGTSVSTTTATVLTGVKASGTATVLTGVKASGTASVAGAVAAKTLSGTAVSAGAHAHTISRTSQSVAGPVSTTAATVMTGATLSSGGAHTHSVTASGSVAYTPKGTISSNGAHSHTYKAPAAHTHTVTSEDATSTATVNVPISAHTHTVGVAAHTHSLSGHTHTTV